MELHSHEAPGPAPTPSGRLVAGQRVSLSSAASNEAAIGDNRPKYMACSEKPLSSWTRRGTMGLRRKAAPMSRKEGLAGSEALAAGNSL